MPHRIQTRVSNSVMRVICRLFFSSESSAQKLRSNFEFLFGADREKLLNKYRDATIESVDLGGIQAESIQATPNPIATIFYLHGGGYFMGSIESYRRNCFRLAYRTNSKVYLINYRLAPENPHPAALEDARRAYHALTDWVDERNLILGGDSAGGGLALALLFALRDDNKPLPRAAFFFSPFADVGGDGNSIMLNFRSDVWLSKRHLDRCASWYCKPHELKSPSVSPVYGNFAGLPPLLIFAGDQEVLLDDSNRVAAAAREAGVSVELIVEKGMQHVWPFALPWLSQSKEALKKVASFIRSVSGGDGKR